MKPPRAWSIRTRLTLWYLGVLSAILFLFSCGISVVMFYQLRTQLDEHAIEELETVEGFFRFHGDGRLVLESIDHDHPTPASAQERFIEVRSPEGAVLYRNELLGRRSLGGGLEPEEGVNQYSERSIRLEDGLRVRLISRRHTVDGRPTIIRLGFNESMLWQRFFRVAGGLFIGLPLVLGLAGLGGHFLARRALIPVARMTRRVQEINADRLHSRIEVSESNDELSELAKALNHTLERLENSFAQLHRFTSDAAHELRTPLTALRTVGEVGLQRRGDSARDREVIESMLEEAGRLTRLIDGLLTVARADSGRFRLEPAPLPLLDFVQDITALLIVLAEEKEQDLVVNGEPHIVVQADRAILRQVVINLLDNAIKYSPRKGKIHVRVLTRGSDVALEIQDSGPGIPAEHRDKVFDRFYRTDDARARDTGGVGLGLAIAKWGVEVNGGRLELDPEVRHGSVFRVVFPHFLNNTSESVQ